MLNKHESRKMNTLKKVKVVADLVVKHYEAGNQAKNLLQIYKSVVNPVYPIGERTFWRYMGIAHNDLGYSFFNDSSYLDYTFERMRPETIKTIKELANKTLKIGTKKKTKRDVYNQNSDVFGVTYPVYIQYMKFAEIYLGYKFNFKEQNKIKERRKVQRANYIINFK